MSKNKPYAIRELEAYFDDRFYYFNEMSAVIPEMSDGGDLREYRRSLGLTQNQMAEILDISVRMYRYYEAGEREDGRSVEVPKLVWIAIESMVNIDKQKRKKLQELRAQFSDAPSSTSGKT